jgi:hypothetical protein
VERTHYWTRRAAILIGCFLFSATVFAILAVRYDLKSTAPLITASVGSLESIDLSKAYTPQTNRNAEFDGNRTAPMTDQQISALAKNVGYEVVNKAHANFDLAQHFIDTKRIVQAAQAQGNNIRVTEYFGMSYWFFDNMPTSSHAGWGKYADTFNTDWYLKDADGDSIAIFNGATPRGQIGYMLDLSNPQYRAWALATMIDWMSQAPYTGITFDNTNILYGENQVLSLVRSDKIKSNQTWNHVFCGIEQTGECDRLKAWNDGLIALLQSTTEWAHAHGMEVFYNGVAATASRGDTRNVGLLRYTDGAYNEDFCYHLDGDIDLKPFVDDIAMMTSQAKAGKKIFEITNMRNEPQKIALGSYCLGGFLMGWQPGSSYWTYHRDYTDNLITYPKIAEQNLNLGNPVGAYTQSGTILSRNFQNGFVAVNTGGVKASITLPFAAIEFKDGSAVGSFDAGATIDIDTLQGRFFLKRDFLLPELADTTKPVISIVGSNPYIVHQHVPYTDQGATALDDRDGDISEQITAIGSVDVHTPDTYTISYKVSDSAGNTATAVRKVIVQKEESEQTAENDTDTSSHSSESVIGGYTITDSASGITTASDQSFDVPVSSVVHITTVQQQTVQSTTPNQSMTVKPSASQQIAPVSGNVITSIEYILDDVAAHTAQVFPDTWSLDTTALTNDWHTLSTNYHYADGTMTSSIKFFKVENKQSILERISMWAVSTWNQVVQLFMK